eukprot:TRINITY_DN14943_c0_g1_i1.p1 TRINITY_DN14943_c0_g1~~TRINITY_DN14943_c0_g1_i1.p1  ORF type:complete len:150 (+),score=19.66 TRINITY_DN14943_c0_g1_i1:248-697(+)
MERWSLNFVDIVDTNCFLNELTNDPRVIAEVLIQYFTASRFPLLPFEFYDSLILSETVLRKEDKIGYLHFTFSTLSDQIREIIFRLFMFFNDFTIAQKFDLNQLIILFGPFLIRPAEVRYYMTEDKPLVESVIRFCIQNVEAIFTRKTM